MAHHVLAEALVHRADTVRGFGDVPRLVTLPPRMRLVLRERELLLLAATRGWRLGAPGTVLSRWPHGLVQVAVQARCAPFLEVRIATETSTLTLAASWRHGGTLASIGRHVG